MVKVEYYRQIFSAFKELCASGKQSCSFLEYCRKHGVSYYRMYLVLKEEYQSLNEIPGYTRGISLKFRCYQVYEEFKSLCADGRQPGTFIDYYKGFGITKKQMESYLWRNKLRVIDLPEYTSPFGVSGLQHKEIPFEDVIFEETGFLPAESSNVITVRVDGNVEVNFPADTDLSVIMKFIRKTVKEDGHVGLDSYLHLWVCQNPVSMRYGIRSLTQVIWSWKRHSLASGDVYVLFSHDHKTMKSLKWDGYGFLMYT